MRPNLLEDISTVMRILVSISTIVLHEWKALVLKLCIVAVFLSPHTCIEKHSVEENSGNGQFITDREGTICLRYLVERIVVH